MLKITEITNSYNICKKIKIPIHFPSQFGDIQGNQIFSIFFGKIMKTDHSLSRVLVILLNKMFVQSKL